MGRAAAREQARLGEERGRVVRGGLCQEVEGGGVGFGFGGFSGWRGWGASLSFIHPFQSPPQFHSYPTPTPPPHTHTPFTIK